MNIIAIDTCGPMISVGLMYQDQVFEHALSVGFQHASCLLPTIDTLFTHVGVDVKNIDLVACTGGPGSFTGLRIGMATGRGLSLAWGKPLVLVSSLLVYVQGFVQQPVLAVLDARKQRFYVALGQHNSLISDEYDADVDQIRLLLQKVPGPVWLTGPGAALLHTQLDPTASIILDPHAMRPRATMMFALAQIQWQTVGACGDSEGPHYLRKSDAQRDQHDAGPT